MIAKAEMLYRVRRFADAEKELRGFLSQTPNHAQAFSLLGLVLLAQGKRPEALREAQNGIRAAPTWDYPHYVMAIVQLHSNHLEDSRKAIQEALRINPRDPRYHAHLGEIYLVYRRWVDVLQSADEGLKIDPNNVQCMILRAIALFRLNRLSQAGTAVEEVLSLAPDNASAHALAGRLHFVNRKYHEAFTSFGEALRLNPDIKFAQEGLVESMKARNPLYRLMLGYFLWVEQLQPRVRWGIIAGGFIFFRLTREALDGSPLLIPIVIIYLGFVFLTWTAPILFDLVLRLDRFGRLALSRQRTIQSNWVGLCLLIGTVLIVAGLFSAESLRQVLIIAGLQTGALILPVAGVFSARSPESRQKLMIYTAVLAGLTIWGLLAGLGGAVEPVSSFLYILGFVAYTWIANIIIERK